MKKINLFSRLWSSGGNSQSSDVGSRCRVVADLLPSFCRVNHVLTLLVVMLFTIGVGNVWGAAVTIASWSGAARTANSEVAPTSSQTDNSSARLKSECALSTAGTSGCAGSYYSTWTNGKCIYLTSLSLSGYTGVSLDISLRRRNATCTAAFYASTDGSTYAGSAWDTKTLSNSCTNYSVSVASNVRAIKIVITGGSGNLWLGEVSLSGTKAASSFTVTYDGNGNSGGTVPTDGTSYSSGATVTVKGNTGSLVKTGYAFGGWNTQADGNGTDRAVGSTFSISANTTLYAKWIPTYTVTYMGNGNTGGSVPTDATAHNSGSTVTVKGNTGSLVKTGWTFAGWNTNATGTGTNYAAGSGTFTISANTTLYAKWTCTVTWSVNGATNVYSATTVTYNSSGSKVASIPSPNPNPASYCGDKFVGWTSDANYVHGTSNLFITAAGSPNLNSTGSTTFYAVFANYDD